MLIIGNHKICLDSVDSTNNAAMGRRGEGLPEGTVIIANEQTKGRGQRSNHWESEIGRNLTMSMILYPRFLDMEDNFYLSKMISLAIHDFLSKYTDNISIKWANDIYIGDRKIAGILIENTITRKTIDVSVIGAGININQEVFSPDIPNPVSLCQVTGQQLNLQECLNRLCQCISGRYHQLKNREFTLLDEEYHRRLYRLGAYHPFREGRERFMAAIQGVEKNGKLMLLKENGEEKKYYFHEVQFVVS